MSYQQPQPGPNGFGQPGHQPHDQPPVNQFTQPAPQQFGQPAPHGGSELAPISQGFPEPTNPYAPATNAPMGPPLGPPGRPQDTTLLLLLTFLTGGIWGLVWYYRAGEDLKRFTGTGMGGGVHLLFALFLGIVEDFILPNEIQHAYDRIGRRSPVSAMTGLWVLLGFWLVIPIFIYMYKVNGALNDLWRAAGAR